MPEKSKKGQDRKAVTPDKKNRKEGERIAKFLARAGIASRRGVEAMIGDGRIKVDQKKLDTPAFFVTGKESILVDGEPVTAHEPTKLWRYHKPTGLITTHKDEQDRRTVFETLPSNMPRVISVGRLDLNSEGLLLLTNDGGLARTLELPRFGWERTYKARVFGAVRAEQLARLKKGVRLDGRRTGPIHAEILSGTGKNRWIEVRLNEGKNREVRRALETLNLQVNRLIRTSFGPFELGQLQRGGLAEVNSRQISQVLGKARALEK